MTKEEIADEMQTLKKEISLLRAVIDSEPNAIGVMDKKGYVIDCNKEMELFYGTKKENLVGKHMSSFVPPHALKYVMADVFRVLTGRKTRGFVNPFIKKDGTTIFVSWNVNPLRDENGKIIGFIVCGRDITEIKNMQEKLNLIFEHTNELYFMHDNKLNFTYLSDNSEKIIGYFSSELLKKKWNLLLTGNIINISAKRTKNTAISSGKRQPPYAAEMKKKDGSKFIASIEESPIKDEKGNVKGVIGAIRDVTAQYKAEEDAREKMEYLEKFKKFSVGREMKMIELKNKLREYEERYGKLK